MGNNFHNDTAKYSFDTAALYEKACQAIFGCYCA